MKRALVILFSTLIGLGCSESRDEQIERLQNESQRQALLLQHQYVSLYKKFLPAFVHISQKKGKKDFETLGSGFFVTRKGLVLTCYHVVAGKKNLMVFPGDKSRPFKAEIYNINKAADLALLKIIPVSKNPKISFIKVPERARPLPGAAFLGIGAPDGLSGTLIEGRVAYEIRRNVDRLQPDRGFIQLTSTVFPGASGGPVFDLRGNLIGMMRFSLSPKGRGSAGHGFAVPANILHDFINSQMIIKEANVNLSRGIVEIPMVTTFLLKKLKLPHFKGILVAEVKAGSPAEKAGLQRYDFITSIEGKNIENLEQYRTHLQAFEDKKIVKVQLFRDGKTISKNISKVSP